MYYRNAQAALVVYDLTKPTSLIKAKHWVAELQRQASPGIVISLVGNKLDLTNPANNDSGGGAGESIKTNAAAPTTESGEAAEGDTEADTGDARKISTKEGRDYAEEEGTLFFETSAKTGVNVQEVFTAIANAIPETQMRTSRGTAGAAGAGGQGTTALGTDRVNLAGAKDGPKEGCAC